MAESCQLPHVSTDERQDEIILDTHHGMLNVCCRHTTATHFFVEPVDSASRDLLVIDRLTHEIQLSSEFVLFVILNLLKYLMQQWQSGISAVTTATCGSTTYYRQAAFSQTCSKLLQSTLSAI
jgi:hypothetical protein